MHLKTVLTTMIISVINNISVPTQIVRQTCFHILTYIFVQHITFSLVSVSENGGWGGGRCPPGALMLAKTLRKVSSLMLGCAYGRKKLLSAFQVIINIVPLSPVQSNLSHVIIVFSLVVFLPRFLPYIHSFLLHHCFSVSFLQVELAK